MVYALSQALNYLRGGRGLDNSDRAFLQRAADEIAARAPGRFSPKRFADPPSFRLSRAFSTLQIVKLDFCRTGDLHYTGLDERSVRPA
ncbi:MAG TPA: hypothetical protein VGI20_15290, partial [Rhizomicrobium sp.]